MKARGDVTEIVDAHHHVWDLAVRPQPWLDQDGLAPDGAALLPPGRVGVLGLPGWLGRAEQPPGRYCGSYV